MLNYLSTDGSHGIAMVEVMKASVYIIVNNSFLNNMVCKALQACGTLSVSVEVLL